MGTVADHFSKEEKNDVISMQPCHPGAGGSISI